jgi:hypothetical protein
VTTTQSTTAKAPVSPKKRAGEGCHAYVENGDLFIMMGGRFRKAEGWDATSILLGLEGSPYPSSQERARQIRAALKETMQ